MTKFTEGYVTFTGDFKQLKPMGFTFQKLFSGNLQTWRKGTTTVYRRQSEIINTEFNMYKLVKFIRETDISKYIITGQTGKRYIPIVRMDEKTGTSSPWDLFPATPENLQKHKECTESDFTLPYISTSLIDMDIISTITAMDKQGWLVLDSI